MASSASQPCMNHCLKVTFPNDLVSRGKRPSEEFEEEDQPGRKRWCSSSPCLSSPNNGLAPSLPHFSPPGDYCDDSDVDDSYLEPSSGEKLDSPTGLSLEEEYNLIFDDDSETSSCARTVGLNTHKDNRAQTLRAFKEEEKGTHVEPLHPVGSSSCKKTSGCPESVNGLSKGSQNQAGFDLGSKGPSPPEAATVNLEKGNDVLGVTEKGSAQAVRETNAGGEGPSVGQASTDKKGPGGENTSSVRDKRENHVQDSHTREPKRPRRICIRETDLESSKEKYINAVLNHACGKPVIGEVNEMLALMQKVASEYQGYSSQHTTDLTVRNYAQRSKSTIKAFSLSQWVDWNGRNVRRFESVPDIFPRSPIPS
ncbi:S100P-binding protein [Sceloporus undulatus]|uniref:S100P-binding protein n=1 Tax=Sceloporus undulatus TaxID=8520 RepID=UPI001C4D607B|nr:S100P-binding protein [Sceloporus undulatus]